MFGRFMPREGKFFDLFIAHAEQIIAGGNELASLMSAVGDSMERAGAIAQRIDAIENKADDITHETVALLHQTFITPLDRESIHQLINGMDDILDLIQDVAESLVLYDIHEVSAEARQLADICQICCGHVQSIVALLHNMGNAPNILRLCREIDTLESEADRVMRSAISKLFRFEPDVRQVMKMKAIYELLETVTDRCEDVANIIEGIVLENS
jgi:hypothetical protein